MFTTIEWDWGDGKQPWKTDGLAIPVVDNDDRRHLVCRLNLDSRRLNNGWIRSMPVAVSDTDIFVDADDPRNANPPVELPADA